MSNHRVVVYDLPCRLSRFLSLSLGPASFRMALRQFLQRGKQLLAPATNFGQWYVATAKKHPFPTAFFTSGIKTSAADLIAQKVSSKRLAHVERTMQLLPAVYQDVNYIELQHGC